MRRAAALVALAVIAGLATSCKDPEHGAYHVRGIWLSVLAVGVYLVGFLAIVAATRLALRARRRRRAQRWVSAPIGVVTDLYEDETGLVMRARLLDNP